jgi:regulator of sigma D
MSEDVINSKQSLDAYVNHIKAQFEAHKYLRVDLKTGKQRTQTQNKALHKYCQMLADKLNDAGLDMKQTLKPSKDRD